MVEAFFRKNNYFEDRKLIKEFGILYDEKLS